MDLQKIRAEVDGRVGVITLDDQPSNPVSRRMIKELLATLDRFEADDEVRCVLVQAAGSDFSVGAGGDEDEEESAEAKVGEYSVAGGALVDRIDFYRKPTIVGARGLCVGGSTAIFNAFDIRIAGESFRIKDGDVYYGNVGSMGMASLRLPRWIGRNRAMDYLFLQTISDHGYGAEKAYHMGIVSEVVADDLLEATSLHYARKMATAAPIAVRHYKESIRTSIYASFEEGRAQELRASQIVSATEDARRGLEAVTRGEQAEFYGN
ncbi:enoyl-CoA hydratase/isomerase family protein [Microbacterium sp. AGC85]